MTKAPSAAVRAPRKVVALELPMCKVVNYRGQYGWHGSSYTACIFAVESGGEIDDPINELIMYDLFTQARERAIENFDKGTATKEDLKILRRLGKRIKVNVAVCPDQHIRLESEGGYADFSEPEL